MIGGGNVAIDAARTALRLGAKEVSIVYRRSRDEMPANSWEIEAAENEGIELQILTAPVEVVVEDGHVKGIRCLKMELGEPDASGRRRPIPVKDSGFVISADTMIAAVAQAPEISFLDETHGLEVTPKGTFAIDERALATNRPGVFAGGDVARGPWILIHKPFGYSLYNPELSPELGYGRYPNVVTSMEFERMLSASGPWGGHITRRSPDHREPKRVAFLQCVGSREKEHDYCSSVCCMYATKEAMLAMEQSLVGKVLSSCAMPPPMDEDRSTR